MKLKFSISIFLGLLITGSAVMAATSASASKRATVDTRSSDNARYAVGAFMGYGLDARGERSQDQSVLARPYHSVVLGFARGPWLTSLEYGTFSESSGNETLSVERQAETVLWWNSWRAEDLRIVQPYMGLGVGASRDKAESLLFSDRRTDVGAWNAHGALGLGLRWRPMSPIYFDIEGRVHASRELDPAPMLSAVLRFGLVLED